MTFHFSFLKKNRHYSPISLSKYDHWDKETEPPNFWSLSKLNFLHEAAPHFSCFNVISSNFRYGRKSTSQISVAMVHRYVQFYCHKTPLPQYPFKTEPLVPIRISLHWLTTSPLFSSTKTQVLGLIWLLISIYSVYCWVRFGSVSLPSGKFPSLHVCDLPLILVFSVNLFIRNRTVLFCLFVDFSIVCVNAQFFICKTSEIQRALGFLVFWSVLLHGLDCSEPIELIYISIITHSNLFSLFILQYWTKGRLFESPT